VVHNSIGALGCLHLNRAHWSAFECIGINRVDEEECKGDRYVLCSFGWRRVNPVRRKGYYAFAGRNWTLHRRTSTCGPDLTND
jgi:hypothetical protein